MPHNPLSWKRHRCAALGDERFGGGEAGGFQLLAEFGLDLIGVLRAVLISEARTFLKGCKPVAMRRVFRTVKRKKLRVEVFRRASACKQKQHGKAGLAHRYKLAVNLHPTIPCVNLDLWIDHRRRHDGLHFGNECTVGWWNRLELILIPAAHAYERDFKQFALHFVCFVLLTCCLCCVGHARLGEEERRFHALLKNRWQKHMVHLVLFAAEKRHTRE